MTVNGDWYVSTVVTTQRGHNLNKWNCNQIGRESNDLMVMIDSSMVVVWIHVKVHRYNRYIGTIVDYLTGTSPLPDGGIAMDVDGPRRRVDGHLRTFEQER